MRVVLYPETELVQLQAELGLPEGTTFTQDRDPFFLITRRLFEHKEVDLLEQKGGAVSALQFYGVSIINYLQGPGKLTTQLTNVSQSITWSCLTNLPLIDLEKYFGPQFYVNNFLSLIDKLRL